MKVCCAKHMQLGLQEVGPYRAINLLLEAVLRWSHSHPAVSFPCQRLGHAAQRGPLSQMFGCIPGRIYNRSCSPCSKDSVPWGERQVLRLEHVVNGGFEIDYVRGAVIIVRRELDGDHSEDREGRKEELLLFEVA